MGLNFQQLFGENATYQDGVVSFNVSDLKDEDGSLLYPNFPQQEITDSGTAIASERVMVALLMYQAIVAKPVRDENGVDITPATQGIVYEDQSFFVGRTFVTREEINQIEHTITVKVYTPDNTGLRAEDVV